jgi:hypothetical protein
MVMYVLLIPIVCQDYAELMECAKGWMDLSVHKVPTASPTYVEVEPNVKHAYQDPTATFLGSTTA